MVPGAAPARTEPLDFVNRVRPAIYSNRVHAARLSTSRSERGTRRAPETLRKLQFMCRGVSGMRICYAG